MKLQMPVDRKVITLVGHTITFKANEPKEVPAAAVKDCLMAGAHIVQGILEDPTPPKVEDLEVYGPEREAAISRQMKKMVARNGRNDFTGTGKPDVFIMNKELGFTVSAQERDELWDKVRESLAAENDPPKQEDNTDDEAE